MADTAVPMADMAVLPDSGEQNDSALQGQQSTEEDPILARHIWWAFTLSWVVNWLLLIMKIIAFALSKSKSVLASMVDSAVDLASQAVISVAAYKVGRYHHRYPVGRGRLEALSVIACACIMTVASLEVIQFSATDLYKGFAKGEKEKLDLGSIVFIILGVGTAMKVALYFYCNWLAPSSDALAALAEDHLNDVASNTGAIIAAVVVKLWQDGWWVDPVGAILISAVIIVRWGIITMEQVRKIVGEQAPEEFSKHVESIALAHDERILVDGITAYHYGSRYNVELEIVLPGEMTVFESHDIAIALQHKVEAIVKVERCHVHVDYEVRNEHEHKVERILKQQHVERKAAKEKKQGLKRRNGADTSSSDNV